MKLYIDDKFGIVPNKLLNNPNISLQAKGLFAYLQSKPNEWKFSIERMAKQLQEGERAIRRAIQELEKAGYLERKPVREGNKFAGYDYILKIPSLHNERTQNERMHDSNTISKKDNSKKDIEKKNNIEKSDFPTPYNLLSENEKNRIIVKTYSLIEKSLGEKIPTRNRIANTPYMEILFQDGYTIEQVVIIIEAYILMEKLLGKRIPTGARNTYTPYLETLLRDGYTIDEVIKAAKIYKEKLEKEGKDPYFYVNFKALSKMIAGLLGTKEEHKNEWF